MPSLCPSTGVTWTFEEPRNDVFRCLPLAVEAGRAGGAYPVALNAANEVAVGAFLDGRITFLRIADLIEEVLETVPDFGKMQSMEAIEAVDCVGARCGAREGGGAMTVLVAMLGLIFLIVIHELGHMLTAKAMGVRVPEFAVGFGPPLIKKKFGKTVYSFRIILLGGFAKMAGMGDGEEGPDTYHAKAAWRRALIILAGPMANAVAAVVILAFVYMFQGVVTEIKPVVSEVETGLHGRGRWH